MNLELSDQLGALCVSLAGRTAFESESTQDTLRRAHEYRDTLSRLFRFDVDLGEGVPDVREDVLDVN